MDIAIGRLRYTKDFLLDTVTVVITVNNKADFSIIDSHKTRLFSFTAGAK